MYFSFLARKKTRLKIFQLYGIHLYNRGEFKEAEKFLRLPAVNQINKPEFYNENSYPNYCLSLLYIRTFRPVNAKRLYSLLDHHQKLKLNFEFNLMNIRTISNFSFKDELLNLNNQISNEYYLQNLFYSKRYEEIIDFFNTGCSDLLDYYSLYIYARTLFSCSRYKEALIIFKILTRKKNKSSIYFNSIIYTASILRYKGSYFRGLKLLKSNMRNCPERLKGKYYLTTAACYHCAGLIDKALKWYKSACSFKTVRKTAEMRIEKILIDSEDVNNYLTFGDIKIKPEIIKKIKQRRKRMLLLKIIITMLPFSILIISSAVIIINSL